MWLRKYTAVAKITLKESLAYRFQALSGALFSFVKIVLAWLLWSAVFGDKQYIGDFTFPMMISYYLVIAFLERLARSEGMIWEISDEVRNGSFTKYLARPLNHFHFSWARSFGKALFSFWIDLAAFALWAVIFRKSLYFPQNLQSLGYFLFFTLAGLFTWLQIHYLIGLISFKTVDIAGPYFLIQNIAGFLSGSFIPLSLLPLGISRIMAYTPFYYILNYPAMIFLNQGLDEIPRALAVLTLWNFLLFLYRKFLFQRMINLFEGVGA